VLRELDRRAIGCGRRRDGTEPIEHGLRPEHGVRRHGPAVVAPVRRPRLARAVAARANEDQVLLGARHRDVQHAQLLGQALLTQPVLHEHRREGWVTDPPRLVGDHEPRPRVTIDEDRARAVGQVDALAEVRQDHDGELEALRRVHTHDPHNVVGGAGNGRLAQVRLLAELLEEAEETGEALLLE
jgi:hypothetical protein